MKLINLFFQKHWKWIIASIISLFAIVIPIIFADDKNENHSQSYGNNSPAINNMNNSQIIYSDTKNPSYKNKREENFSSAELIVEKYFELLNLNKFSEACSFLPITKCNVEKGEDIANFSKERMKYINGYENLKIWKPTLNSEFHSEIVCVKYSYTLKADTKPYPIWEVLSFYLDKRESDDFWEITSRVCEKKFKDGSGERTCPVVANQKFCL